MKLPYQQFSSWALWSVLTPFILTLPEWLALPGHVSVAAENAQTVTIDEELPDSVAGNSLEECRRQLEAQGGGWCRLGENLFDTAASPMEVDHFEGLRGASGPGSIFTAWNGMAIDRQDKKLYFLANGGHGDYLGNGVYEFDMRTAEWTRLRDPCELSVVVEKGGRPSYGGITFNSSTERVRIPDPECGPASSHTYDGVQFASKTGTIFWASGIYGLRGGTFHSNGELWEFNPSKGEARNGLEPLGWRMHDLEVPGRPASAELADGTISYGANFNNGIRFDPADPRGTVEKIPGMGNDYGNGNVLFDADRGVHWFLSVKHGVLRVPLDARGEKYAEKATGFGMGSDIREGKIVLWNGRDVVTVFDPDEKTHKTLDWRGKKPSSGGWRVYSKWAYLPEEDLFVGIAVEETGVMVYRHPDVEGVEASTVDPQEYIDAAKPGEEVTIPPGVYRKGIRVDKPLTVRMEGVTFRGAVDRKGAVVVNSSGPVVLDGYTVDTPPGCSSNCAGLRIEGEDYEVTLRNATLLYQEMGVLTGNEGGRLVIEDSEIGRTGGGSALSHVVYAGWSDELVIRRSVIHDSRRLGHLVKSRAAVTRIVDSKILGRDSRHSRLIEIPCGGELVIEGSTLQQSARTDNPEFMMVGGSSGKNCAGNAVRDVSISLVENRLITHRDKSDDEPARGYGATALMHYRAPNPPAVNEDGGNIVLAGNSNERGGDNESSPIEVLWYESNNYGTAPPVDVLEATRGGQ